MIRKFRAGALQQLRRTLGEPAGAPGEEEEEGGGPARWGDSSEHGAWPAEEEEVAMGGGLAESLNALLLTVLPPLPPTLFASRLAASPPHAAWPAPQRLWPDLRRMYARVEWEADRRLASRVRQLDWADAADAARLCAFLHVPPVVLRHAARLAGRGRPAGAEAGEAGPAALKVVDLLEASVEAVRAIGRESTPEAKARRIVEARRAAMKLVAEAHAAEGAGREGGEGGGRAGWVEEDEVVPCIILATLRAASDAASEEGAIGLRVAVRYVQDLHAGGAREGEAAGEADAYVAMFDAMLQAWPLSNK
jgi:hypothetical protein